MLNKDKNLNSLNTHVIQLNDQDYMFAAGQMFNILFNCWYSSLNILCFLSLPSSLLFLSVSGYGGEWDATNRPTLNNIIVACVYFYPLSLPHIVLETAYLPLPS